MKKILALIITLLLSTSIVYAEQFSDISVNQLLQRKSEAYTKMSVLHELAENARAIGYSDESDLILLLKEDWEKNCTLYNLCSNELKEKETEYPEAFYVWTFLKDQGYNDYVCSGIIGNMMCECGGYTLSLDTSASTNSFYGICQWSKRYFPEVNNTSLEEQCNFLISNIEAEFDIYGKNYKSNFSYSDFLELENEREAALAFAKCYERCSSASYKLRQNCAEKALNYFCN